MRILCCPVRSPWRASSWLPGGDLRSESVWAACIMASLRNATLLTGSSCFENLPVQIFSASVPEKLSITSLSYHVKRETRVVRNGSGHTVTPTVADQLVRPFQGQIGGKARPAPHRQADFSTSYRSLGKSFCSPVSRLRCGDLPDCGCIHRQPFPQQIYVGFFRPGI